MRLEYRIDAAGERTVSLETEDMVPGMEAEPWIEAWRQTVEDLGPRLPLPDPR